MSYPFEFCGECPLFGRTYVPGVGPKGKYMVIGEAPGYEEASAKIKTPFIGASGQLLRRTLESIGISQEDVYFTNIVHCHPPENRTPDPSLWTRCCPTVLNEIFEIDPQKILSVGAIALSALARSTFALPITKHRGISRELSLLLYDDAGEIESKYYWMPTFHPANVLRQVDSFRDFANDIEKWKRLSAPIPEPKINVIIPKESSEAAELLHDLREEVLPLSCDLETTGLDPLKDSIESIGFGIQTLNSFVAVIITRAVLEDEDIQSRVQDLILSYPHPIAFHNIKFDLQFLDVFFDRHLRLKNPWDTMLMHYALDERAEGRYQVHGLKVLSARYDIPDYHFNFDSFYAIPKEERPYDKLFEYQGLDLYVTAKLFEDLYKELESESDKLIPLVRDHLVPAAITYGEVELRGVKIDRPYLEELKVSLESELVDLLSKLRSIAGSVELYEEPINFNPDSWNDLGRLLQRSQLEKDQALAEIVAYQEAQLTASTITVNRRRNIILNRAYRAGLYQEGRDFNPNSSTQAPELVRRLGITTDSTERESLWLAMSQQDTPPEIREKIDRLIEYRQKSKIYSTYVVGLLDAADQNDRVHPDYIIPGSGTGRPACSNPNLQNIPMVMGPAIRNAFTTDEDWVFGIADYSQLELRVVMHLAHDEGGINAYKEGRDIHREVASAMFHKPPEEITYFERYMAKYVDFGVIYGRGAKSLVEGWEMEYLAQQGGTRWTIKQGVEFINEFLDQFVGVKNYIKHQQEFVVSEGYVETLMGRRRRFPFIPADRKLLGYIWRQAVNTPIQSLASDLNMSAWIRLHDRLSSEFSNKAYLLFSVYDSIAFECLKSHLLDVARVIVEEMKNLPVKLDVPIEADIEVGPSWGKTQKLDLTRGVLIDS